MLSEKFIFIGSAVIEITRPGAAAGGRWCDPTPPHMAPRSHYDVLDLRDSAVSTDDIKRAYKAQALRWHPDKPDGNVEEFVLVTKAFETLSDPTVRRQYDAALIHRQRKVVVNEIDLEDMAIEGDEGGGGSMGGDGNTFDDGDGDGEKTKYSYACRCGDKYEITRSDLHPDFDFIDIPCASCSLNLRVSYGPVEEDV